MPNSKPTPTLSARDRRAVANYAISRIEYFRQKGDCGPQDVPQYDATKTDLEAGSCQIVIGTEENGDPYLHVFPPVATGLRQWVDVSDALKSVLRHPSVTPPTLGGRAAEDALRPAGRALQYHCGGELRQFDPQSDELPSPIEIDATSYGVFEKLVRYGDKVPRHLWVSIVEYVEDGGHMGTALTAIFENNLMIAAAHSDDIVSASISDICRFLHNHLPIWCLGSAENVAQWRKDRLAHNVSRDARTAA